MSDLINRLRGDFVPSSYHDIKSLLTSAADALEAQAKEIAELRKDRDDCLELSKLNWTKAEQYRLLCNMLGHALEIGWSPYYVNGVDAKVLAEEALTAWRESK